MSRSEAQSAQQRRYCSTIIHNQLDATRQSATIACPVPAGMTTFYALPPTKSELEAWTCWIVKKETDGDWIYLQMGKGGEECACITKTAMYEYQYACGWDCYRTIVQYCMYNTQ